MYCQLYIATDVACKPWYCKKLIHIATEVYTLFINHTSVMILPNVSSVHIDLKSWSCQIQVILLNVSLNRFMTQLQAEKLVTWSHDHTKHKVWNLRISCFKVSWFCQTQVTPVNALLHRVITLPNTRCTL